MNLRSAEPYWLYHSPEITSQDTLHEDIHTDVVVVGSGISGALAAYKLVKAGVKVTIISRDRAGTASTCASTSLLQYEIDTPLRELTEKVSKSNAERSYLLCHDSIDHLEKIHKVVGASGVFHRRPSLLLASYKKDVVDLQTELEMRNDIGIQVRWLKPKEIFATYGFDAPGAILSAQGAVTDAYFFTQKLIQWCEAHGAKVYDHVEVTGAHESPRSISLATKEGYTIHARYAVMATGYEATKWIDQNVARLHSTFAIISKPVPVVQLWSQQCLIWETAKPYLYLRTTDDHRIIIGGKDDPFSSAHKRDIVINEKAKMLLKAFYKKFPEIVFDIDYKWAGTFGETADGLPYIGPAAPASRILFSLGYGGNGITFSEIGAVIIRDIVTGHHNADLKRYSFGRLNYK